MRAALVALVFMATPAMAGGPWIAEMIEDEGGEVLMAHVDGDAGEPPPSLWIACADTVMIRYDAGSGSPGVEPGTEATLVFDTGKARAELPTINEGMDGMWAGYVARDHPVLAALKGGAEVTISDAKGTLPAATLTLAKSAAAIDAVLKGCS
jgi:hypothetical protein